MESLAKTSGGTRPEKILKHACADKIHCIMKLAKENYKKPYHSVFEQYVEDKYRYIVISKPQEKEFYKSADLNDGMEVTFTYKNFKYQFETIVLRIQKGMFKKGEIFIRVPEKLITKTSRKFYRIIPPLNNPMFVDVKMDEEVVRYKVKNLSGSGLAIAKNEDEETVFSANQVLQGKLILDEEHAVDLKFEILDVKEDFYSGNFLDVKDSDQDIIVKKINEIEMKRFSLGNKK